MKLIATSLLCDTSGCGATFPEAGFRPGNDIQSAARRAGWAHEDGADRCPAHRRNAVPVDKIRELAARGMTDQRIGDRYGLSRSVIRGIRLANGIPGQPPGRPSLGAGRGRA